MKQTLRYVAVAIGLILIYAALMPENAAADSAAIENGLTWLSAQQNPDNGAWGSDTIRETATVVDVLKDLEPNGTAYSNGVGYLKDTNPFLTDYLSRKIVSMAGAGRSIQDDVTLLLSFQNPDNGFGFAAHYPSSVPDSLLAAQALAKAGVVDQQVIGRLLYYLPENQNQDGSFSFCLPVPWGDGGRQEDEGNLYLTAYAVQVLSPFVSSYANLKPYVDSAVAFLYYFKQDDDGSFVSPDASPVITTALAARALVAAEGDAATILGARQYLLAVQQGNGSWENDPVATALALGALASTALPNLAIDSSSIQLTPSIPASGQMVRISATVSNTGAVNITISTKAKFYLGAPTVGSGGVLLGIADIGLLQAGSSQQVSWYGKLPFTAGNKTVYVVANEDSAHFAETTYADNIASKTFTMSTMPDLEINDADIVFSNASPLSYEPFDVVAYIHNLGETGIGNVQVALYDGDPESSGQELLRLTIPDIEGGSYGRAAFTLNLPPGGHDLYVWVDPDGEIAEASIANNMAMKHIWVGGAGVVDGIDLFVASSEITFSNPNPRQGEQFTITSKIRNTGSVAAHNVPVSLYAVNSKGARTQLSNPTVDIGGDNAFEFVLNNVTLPAETYQIHVYADDGDTIAEADENNNEGYQNLTVLKASDRIDLEAGADFITFEPEQPMLGDVVAIRCGVTNTGTLAISNAKIRMYEDAVGDAGKLMAPEVTVPLLGPGRTAWITVNRNTAGWGGSHEIYVVADPDNLINEYDETNNQAQNTLTVYIPDDTVDFAVDNTSIQIDPAAPVVGDNMTITVRVNNLGTVAADAALALYNGDPRGHAELVELTPVESVPNNGFVDFTFRNIDAARFASAQSLCVAVKPAPGVLETDDSNNIACIPNVVLAPDLVFKSDNITTIPPEPVSNQQFTVQAIVQNIGRADADGIQVAIYSENPVPASTPLATAEILHIGEGEEGIAALPVTLAAGSYRLYLVVDPLHVVDNATYNYIPESNEENNSASIVVDVAAAPICQEEATRFCGPCNDGTQTCTGGVWQECVSQNEPQTFYRDADSDGYGNPAVTIQACAAPDGYVANSDDCNDSDSTVHQKGTTRSCGPCNDGTQTCTGGDWQECSAAPAVPTFYLDADSDGYGNSVQTTQACTAPEGYVSNSADCDDSDNATNPGATETPDNGKDDDCNPFTRDNSTQDICGKENAVSKGANWIASHQSAMGAWPTHNSLSNNAHVLHALALAGQKDTPQFARLLQRIYDTQATNGSWAGVRETSYSIIALVEAGESPDSPVIINAVNWLIKGRTASNGSWGNNIPSTGLAIVALITAGVDPDSDYVQVGIDWLISVRSCVCHGCGTGHCYWGESPGDPIASGISWYPGGALALANTPNNPIQYYIENTVNGYMGCSDSSVWENSAALNLYYYTNYMPTWRSIQDIKTDLKDKQRSNGSWPDEFPGAYQTADSLIALLRTGEQGEVITKAVNYLLSSITDSNDYPLMGEDAGTSAQAALALQYAYPNGFVEQKKKALSRFIQTQSSSGSWVYTLTTDPNQWTGAIHLVPPVLQALSNLTVDVPPTGITKAIDNATNYLNSTRYNEYAWTALDGLGLSTNINTTCSSIISLADSGGLPTDYSRSIDWIISKRQNGNWGSNTYLAVIALSKTGYASEVTSAVSWLKEQQNSDGGYGSVSATSWALIALSQVGEFGLEMQKGVAYLLSLQKPDGGWASLPGIPASNTYDTASATWALAVSQCQADIGLKLSFDNSTYLPGEIVTMTVTPAVNVPADMLTLTGSVSESGGSAYPVAFTRSGNGFAGTHILSDNHTAGTDVVSVTAESGQHAGVVVGTFTVKTIAEYLPDLAFRADKITFSTNTFLEGRLLTITAHAANIGLHGADNVTVACYDGDPANGGILIGESYLGLLTVNQAVDVQFTWREKRGAHDIYVVISSGTSLHEPTYENNQYFKSIQVTEQNPDFTYSGAWITFSPDSFFEGQQITITAHVVNYGNLNGENIKVACYDGNPDTGGTLIDNKTIDHLNVQEITDVAFAWKAKRGERIIYLRIDPDNAIKERDEGNNDYGRRIDVAPGYPDLAITSDKISFSSDTFREGEPVTITAQVANIGQSDAEFVTVACYDGDPANGGVLIGERTMGLVSMGGSVDVPFAWRADGGIHEIHVVVDPHNVIRENREDNNRAYRLTLASEPDLAVDADDIVLSPQDPLERQPVTITATIHNLGQQAGDVTVRFLDGATLLCPDQTIPAIGAGGSQTLTATWDRATPQGRHFIHVIVDPEDNIIEAQENNNEAIRAIDVGVGGMSDLSIAYSDIPFSPANPLEGDLVTMNATVTNWGSMSEGKIYVWFYDGDTQENSIIGERIIYESLDFGQSASVSVPWDSTDKKGDHDIFVYVKNWGDENWDDNTAQADLFVGASGLSVAVVSDREIYSDNESVAITATITNENTEPREVVYELLLVDSAGATIARPTQPETLAVGPDNSTVRTATWNTGSLPAGDYIITAQVSDNGAVRAIGRRQITITANLGLEATLTTDRMNYAAHEQVRITASVRSLSPNYRFTDLWAQLLIIDAAGAVMFGDSGVGAFGIDPLSELQTFQWATIWNTETIEPGTYRLLLSVFNWVPYNYVLAAQDNATITILPSQPGDKSLQGDVSIQAAELHTGFPVIASFRVTNKGNTDIDSLPVTIKLMLADTQQVVRTDNETCHLPIDASCSGPIVFETAGLPPDDYLIVLSCLLDNNSQTIAFAPLRLLNQCPVADAGSGAATYTGQTVTLDGSGSSDPDNDAITYHWVLTGPTGSGAELAGDTASVCTLTPDRRGDYVVELIVSDEFCSSTADRVIVTAVNRPPVADAGADQLGHVGDMITLSAGDSFDPDGDAIAGWQWEFVEPLPDDSAAVLNNADNRTTTFTIDKKGEYRVILKVFDGLVWSEAADEVVITAENRCPVAEAGANRLGVVGVATPVDGSGSYDLDGDLIAYRWALVSRPERSMAEPDNDTKRVCTITPDRRGDYVFELVVSDGSCDSVVDNVTVSTDNRPPVARAGEDKLGHVGDTMTLDGSASSDPDNDTITAWQWELTKPAGSTAHLTTPDAITTAFTIDRRGEYRIRLKVFDGLTWSEADEVVVSTENRCPVAVAGDNQTAHTGQAVMLNGRGSRDPDNDTITYHWALNAPQGSTTAQLDNASSATPTFTPDMAGRYVAVLIVNDGICDSPAARVTVTVVNECPVADAGDDQSVETGQTVTLDGSASFDPDNDSITYMWVLTTPQGSTAALDNQSAGQPAFTPDKPGAYTATLVVSDGVCSSVADSVSITVAEDNPAPDCNDIDVPEPPCAMKTDYGPGGATGDAVNIYSYADYQKYVASNYGYKNGKYKKLKIAGSITMTTGDLVMHSPASIEIGKNVKLKAPAGAICLDGRMGVKTELVYLEAEQVALMSQSGDVSLGQFSQVNADGLYVSAAGSGNLEDHVLVTVDGPVTMLSTGFGPSAIVAIRQAAAVMSQSLVMRGMGAVQVSEFADLEIAGPMRMVSTGLSTGSNVWVKYGAVVKAGSVCLSGAEDVSVGPGSIIDAGEVSVMSTGAKSSSKAAIKPATLVKAVDMTLSGSKAWLEPFSLLLIRSTFTMNAALPGGCSVKGCYRAGSTAGNCLE